jgi:hypothetical protein
MPKKFWGHVFEMVAETGVALVAIPALVTKGTIDFIASGGEPGSFHRGAEGVIDGAHAFVESCVDFGDKHSEAITEGIVHGVAKVAGEVIAAQTKEKFTDPDKEE